MYYFNVMHSAVQKQIEYELAPSQAPPKNKVLLMALEVLVIPALCGVDRCYMGQPCLGGISAQSTMHHSLEM